MWQYVPNWNVLVRRQKNSQTQCKNLILVDPFMFCCFLSLSAAFHLHLHKSSLFKLLSQVCPFSRPEFLKHKLFIVPNIHKNIKKKIEIFWHFLFAERICTEKRIFSISFYENYWLFRYKKLDCEFHLLSLLTFANAKCHGHTCSFYFSQIECNSIIEGKFSQ